MENVGESKARNSEFDKSFSRARLIRDLIDARIATPVIFDVGGHKGESIIFLRNQFPAAEIHSFEPDPAIFAHLANVADARTHCHNLALSEISSKLRFFRNRISHTSSLFPINLESQDSIYLSEVRSRNAAPETTRFNEEIEVEAERLDHFCARHGIEAIDLLKIDVQGAEFRVLAGAGALLERVGAVIAEVSFYDYYQHRGSFLEIERSIAPFGFRLFSISEISNNPMNGRTDWAEVIYTRDART
jgi:FkbM family methyltransferase